VAGGAAPVGAALVADDPAGKVDQNRGQGGAPCPASGLQGRGGGSSASVVLVRLTSNRPRAPARRGRWMNERRMKTSAKTSGLSSPPARKAVLGVNIRAEYGGGSKKWGFGAEEWIATASEWEHRPENHRQQPKQSI